MVFTHRIAALAAVVAIPLGIAVTSYALTDTQDDRKVPTKVELESGSPASPNSPPKDETVSPAPVDRPPTPSRSGKNDSDDSDDGASPSPSASASPSPSPSGDDDDDGPGGDDAGDDG
ncbi:small secreted hydrophilic protein [Streptomyces sp. NPDC049906]|uniref:small secreted hydrophilic protein n=1 Tax=Streptomyces sp. NPDC049906 TaxID=3155656 RepID=UPI00342DCEA8